MSTKDQNHLTSSSRYDSYEGKLYYRIRNVCGLLGLLLPYLALFSASLAEHPSPEWWWSISATYYQTPAMVGLLLPACIVLICYIGYDKTDNIVTTVAGIAGLFLAMFPCKVSWIPDGTPVGFFSIPIEISRIVHAAASVAFFTMLAVDILFLFPKSAKPTISEGKKFRNKIYRFCGIGMFVVMVIVVVNNFVFHARYLMIFFEILLLNLFGVAWLVKGRFFHHFRKKGSPLFRIFVTGLFLLSLCGCSRRCPAKPIQGTVTDLGGIEVVSLCGTWEEMGRQYGELVGTHLHRVKAYVDEMIGDDEAKDKNIRERAENLFCRYPYDFRRFVEGCSQTSGLSFEELKIVNALEYAEGFFCSGIAVWGDYAKNNLVFGRNYDAVSYGSLAKDVIITVFHPSDGSIPTAIVGYAGEIYAVNALNRAGIFLELNNGFPSAGDEILFDSFAGTTTMLQAMFQASNLDYLDAFFKTNRSFASFIIGVADKDEARAYEWCSAGVRRVDPLMPEGLLTITNHYVDSSWGFPVPTDEQSWNSLTRRSNLCNLARENKGGIDAERMCRIISTPIEEGGPMHNVTRYQMVYEPSTMTLYVRTTDTDRWTIVDMNRFF